MELNTEGFYKKPRVLSGFKFLSHITETRKCGNRMPETVLAPIDFQDHYIKNTRLRVREGKIATEYLLDHVKRMHV